MAYLPIDDEDENQQGQPAQQGSEKVLAGESSVVGGSGGGAAPAGGSPKGTSSGSGWTNLTNYVKANEGQDQRMGEAVKGQYQRKEDANQQTVGQYGSTAEKAVKDSTVTDNGTVAALQNIKPAEIKLPTADRPGRQPQPATADAGAKKVTRGGGVQQQPVAGQQPAPPTLAESQSAYTPELVTSFSNQIKGWQGPDAAQSIEGFHDSERAVQDTQATAARTNDFEGRRTFLRDAYQDPRYSQGEQRLDSFLTGAGAGGRQQLDAIQASAGAKKTGWEDLVNRLGQDITAGRETTEKTRTDTLDAFKGASERLGSAFTDAQAQVEALNAGNTNKYTQAVDAMKSGNPERQAWGLAQAGVSPEVGAWLLSQGVPPEEIIKQGKGLGLGDVAGDENMAAWDFLNQLAGAGGDANAEALKLGTFDLSKIGGTGQAFDVNFDAVGAGSEAMRLQSELEGRLKKAQADRTTEEDRIRADLAGLLGSDPSQAIERLHKDGILDRGLAEQALALGLNPADFIRSGSKLQLADVMTDEDRSGWSSLMKKLGIKGGLKTKDDNDEGAAWTFDREAFDAAVGKKITGKKRELDMKVAKETSANKKEQEKGEEKAKAKKKEKAKKKAQTSNPNLHRGL